MTNDEELRNLFDRWERVWHEDQHQLIATCLASRYVRHDASGERTVSAESYAAELASVKEARPGIRVVVYDHMFAGKRAWFRFTFKWRDRDSGVPQTQAGMQSYRIENGKLAETWIALQPPGSAWPDAVAQERWTSPSTRSD